MASPIAGQSGAAIVVATVTTFNVTLAQNVRIGDDIIFGAWAGVTAATISLGNDSLGNVFSSVPTTLSDSGVGVGQLFHSQIQFAGTSVVTVTFSISTTAYGYGYAGYAGDRADGDLRDGGASGMSSNAGTSPTMDSLATAAATTVANEHLAGFAVSETQNAITQPASWTQRGGVVGLTLADRLTNTSGTAYNYAPTQASTTFHSHIVAILGVPVGKIVKVLQAVNRAATY